MTPSQNNSRWRSVMAVFYTQEMSNKGTADGPQGRSPLKNGLKYLPMKTDPILTAEDSYDYMTELLDRFIQARGLDEQLVNEMFQTFGTIVAIGFGDIVFVRDGCKWPLEQTFRRGGQ